MQHGSIFRTKKSWFVRWYEFDTSDTGKKTRVRRHKLLGPILPEHRKKKNHVPPQIAEQADAITKAVNRGAKIGSPLTIAQLAEEYLKAKECKESYAIQNRHIWTCYLKDRIGPEKVQDFTLGRANRLWKEIKKKKVLSIQTMNHIRYFVSDLFRYALREEYYTLRPGSLEMMAIKVGRQAKMGVYVGDLPDGLKPYVEKEAYTDEELVRLFKLFPDIETQTLFMVAFCTGLRQGEIEGLRWTDYERKEDGGALHVRQSVSRGKVCPPKNEDSVGERPLVEKVAEYIDLYRKSLGGIDQGFMFQGSTRKSATNPNKEIRPINLGSFRRHHLFPVLRRCGVCLKHWNPNDKHWHDGEDHDYQRDTTVPTWKGYHSLRRGTATKVKRALGLLAASHALHHADTGATKIYVKDTPQQRREDREVQQEAAQELVKQNQLAAAEAVAKGLPSVTVKQL